MSEYSWWKVTSITVITLQLRVLISLQMNKQWIKSSVWENELLWLFNKQS